MNNLIAIFITNALVSNFILTRFLGLCPFLGVSKKITKAVNMGAAVTLVMTLASVATWILFYQILEPLGIIYMRTVVFILVIATLVQITEVTIKRTNTKLYNALGVYLPLITTNCAIMGLALINVQESYTLIETIISALGAGLGFTLVMLLMSGIRERLNLADTPESFEGTPIAFIVAMMLSMIFIAFGGMI